MQIVSFSPFGYEGSVVSIEVDLRRGIPAIDLVGLADNSVRESRERMRAAIRNSDFEFPKERVLISLSPADVRKEGAGFDLAIALAVLIEQYKQRSFEDGENSLDGQILIMGELELSGKIRAVRGINAAVSTAASLGIKYCIVPSDNYLEASGIIGIKVYSCDYLHEAYEILVNCIYNKKNQEIIEEKKCLQSDRVEFEPVLRDQDFAQVKGLDFLVRALQIAASGNHNLMVYGPPGCGKTLALQRFPSILPKLSLQESQSVTRIYSLAGLMPTNEVMISRKPFRMPHQSASLEGMVGGGINCRPGEVSLAHNGVLFLDEAAEFRATVLQSLRVPLEEGKVTLSRAGRHTVFPASFQLLLATNPCPCGNFGDNEKICVCSAHSVEQYWKKFSSPLLDRIDIRVPVFNTCGTLLNKVDINDDTVKSSAFLRKDIEKAVLIQRKRQGKMNGKLTPEEIDYFCKLDSECFDFLAKESKELLFSARAVHSTIKLARTIADMTGSYAIRKSDIEEAILYRKNEGGISLCF